MPGDYFWGWHVVSQFKPLALCFSVRNARKQWQWTMHRFSSKYLFKEEFFECRFWLVDEKINTRKRLFGIWVNRLRITKACVNTFFPHDVFSKNSIVRQRSAYCCDALNESVYTVDSFLWNKQKNMLFSEDRKSEINTRLEKNRQVCLNHPWIPGKVHWQKIPRIETLL